MKDLLKDLAQAKPPTPEVDPERMERDLARILSTPRQGPVRTRALIRRFAPALVAVVVIVVAVALLPKSGPTVRPAAPPHWWHMLTEQRSVMLVGDPANPYLVELDSMTDRWLAAESQVMVVQKNGAVTPYAQDGDAKWEAAGKPATVPQVGGNHAVRIGPMQPAVLKTGAPDFTRFEAMPTDLVELKKALEAISGKGTYGIASLAMKMMTANVSDEQRRAAFDLIKTLDGARPLGLLTTRKGLTGIGVGIAAPQTFQFTDIETELVINQETGLPIVRRDVITTPQHGWPAGMSIVEEEYLLLERTTIDPIVPQDVPVNGEVQSPIIER
jgi:hypothetical protein